MTEKTESCGAVLVRAGFVRPYRQYNCRGLVLEPVLRSAVCGRDPVRRRHRGVNRYLGVRWSDGPHAYLDLASASFPNMFMITGPLSPSELRIVTVSIEHHVDWIGDAIEDLRDHDLSVAGTDEAAEAEWDDEAHAVVSRTLHPHAKFTYWWGGNIPGEPRMFTLS
jgi:hypothetical protein